jgi:hypothetical protein
LACHLQIDADPDPAYQFYADPDVDPDPDFYLMLIRILIFILCESGSTTLHYTVHKFLENTVCSSFNCLFAGGIPAGQENRQEFREQGHDGSAECCGVRLRPTLHIRQHCPAPGNIL